MGQTYRFAPTQATRIRASSCYLLPLRRRCFDPMSRPESLAKAVVLIPARMAATRLPGKPLADINGKPMIAHVIARAADADIGPVCVATDDRDIAAAAEAVGCKAVMTRADHVSGSDRIF